jgi:hypothetical protein
VEAVPAIRDRHHLGVALQGWGYAYLFHRRSEFMDRANRRRAFFKIVSRLTSTHCIKLVAGRTLSDSDRAGAPSVALINETLAMREFPGEDPIGRRILVQELVPGQD